MKAKTIKMRDEACGFTARDLDEAKDFPELTDEQIASARTFDEVFPEMAASIKRIRGPQKAPTKQQISLRIDRDVVEHFKARGPGWQVRMGEVLRKAAGL